MSVGKERAQLHNKQTARVRNVSKTESRVMCRSVQQTKHKSGISTPSNYQSKTAQNKLTETLAHASIHFQKEGALTVEHRKRSHVNLIDAEEIAIETEEVNNEDLITKTLQMMKLMRKKKVLSLPTKPC